MAGRYGSRGGDSLWTFRRKIREQVRDNANLQTFEPANESVHDMDNDQGYNAEHFFESDSYSDHSNSDHEYSSSSESQISDDEDTSVMHLQEQMARWACEFNITTSSLGALLCILKPYHSHLPKDPRTLLHTPTTYPIRKLSGGGELCYFGMKSGIQRLVDNGKLASLGVADPLMLQINVDGLPIFKSSQMQLWPILCLVELSSITDPFVVAAFCGNKKPCDLNEFFT